MVKQNIEWCKEKRLKMREQRVQSLVIDDTVGCLWKREGPEDEREGRKDGTRWD